MALILFILIGFWGSAPLNEVVRTDNKTLSGLPRQYSCCQLHSFA